MEFLFGDHLTIEEGDVDGKLISLRDAINSLREEQRKCIELMYLEKKSYNEIAQMTGYSLTKVKSYIQNGKRNLKNMLVPR